MLLLSLGKDGKLRTVILEKSRSILGGFHSNGATFRPKWMVYTGHSQKLEWMIWIGYRGSPFLSNHHKMSIICVCASIYFCTFLEYCFPLWFTYHECYIIYDYVYIYIHMYVIIDMYFYFFRWLSRF